MALRVIRICQHVNEKDFSLCLWVSKYTVSWILCLWNCPISTGTYIAFLTFTKLTCQSFYIVNLKEKKRYNIDGPVDVCYHVNDKTCPGQSERASKLSTRFGKWIITWPELCTNEIFLFKRAAHSFTFSPQHIPTWTAMPLRSCQWSCFFPIDFFLSLSFCITEPVFSLQWPRSGIGLDRRITKGMRQNFLFLILFLGWWLYDTLRHSSNLIFYVESVCTKFQPCLTCIWNTVHFLNDLLEPIPTNSWFEQVN